MRYIYDSYTEIGGRAENEDSIAVTACGNNVIAVVADGLGGQGDGKTASQSVCESLLCCGRDGTFPSEEALCRAFEEANRALMQKQSNRFHMKSTATYICLQGSRAVWAHVGDSRLYHLYEGKICDYTIDHSASQLAVFMGLIQREEIPGDAGRSRLLRAMGVEDTAADVHEAIELRPGRHGFLLCSDGLWEYLTDEEIEQSFQRSSTASACLRQLRESREKKAPADGDNNSGIAILLEV